MMPLNNCQQEIFIYPRLPRKSISNRLPLSAVNLVVPFAMLCICVYHHLLLSTEMNVGRLAAY